ncbi:RraA family protein [Streptomyces sp. 110]|uniref:Putative 4-hydroxy-4-methyl-2-oxoglutarate aldolase n=1 Tax=Streptomyces endocoffeicus TaxID=2898945 RepID=A0ABS1Q7X6_9ACTN|nr:RraA family protein [Streptomyces endocoffeicus]MBL1120766.1 RraA family protein [Streptomyces endocoffeicus]
MIREQLYTPVVGDVLDQMGLVHQFLPPEIRGITTDAVVVGRAMPVLIADVFEPQAQPFGRLTEALDQLQLGEVYLVRNGDAVPCAAWGEILTVTARVRGAAGAVVDGYHRDTSGILEQGWPVFSRGAYAQDAGVRKAVLDFRVPIEIGTVRVTPGDLVVGDRDGVLVVPADVEDEVLGRALEKAGMENLVRKAIESGMSSTEAFAEFGVL